MSMMGQIEVRRLDWFAVRFRVKNNPGRVTCMVEAEFESYRNRHGQLCKRRIPNTGRRAFVPELLARRAGFEVFLPVRKDWRRRNQFSAERELRSYPMMPGWMFVGWDAGANLWPELLALDVVTGVLGAGGRPLRISEAEVIGMMRRWGGGRVAPELNRYMRAGHEFEAGDVMRIAQGPFADFQAKVVEINGPEAQVVVDIFGRENLMKIETVSLERP